MTHCLCDGTIYDTYDVWGWVQYTEASHWTSTQVNTTKQAYSHEYRINTMGWGEEYIYRYQVNRLRATGNEEYENYTEASANEYCDAISVCHGTLDYLEETYSGYTEIWGHYARAFWCRRSQINLILLLKRTELFMLHVLLEGLGVNRITYT